MKICPVGAELFHADRQTDMMKLRVTFAILWKCLKMERNKICNMITS